MVKEIKNREKKDIEDDIERLHDWLLMQPHLPHDIDKVLLSTFVQGTKSLEIAKKKLDTYFCCKTRYPKIYDFKERDASTKQFIELSSSVEIFYLPKPTPDGYRVFALILKDNIEDIFEHTQMNNRFLMAIELGMLYFPDAKGYITFFDAKPASPTFVTKLSPTAIAASAACIQGAFPIRVKSLTIFNTKPFIEFALNTLFKPVLSEKLFSRISITTQDMSVLKEILPEEILPSNYGGKEKSSSELNEIWLNIMAEKKDWFKQGCDQIVDESKRPPDSENTYGIEGTFRKLAVD